MTSDVKLNGCGSNSVTGMMKTLEYLLNLKIPKTDYIHNIYSCQGEIAQAGTGRGLSM